MSPSPQADGPALVDGYDAVLLDLDGVVYVGPAAVPGAREAIDAVRARGHRVAYLTNNASRPAAVVAAHLRELGITLDDGDVVTAAQAAAKMVADHVEPGAAVLVVGGEGLIVALRDVGLRPVSTYGDAPTAVVQGFSPDVGWRLLNEGVQAVRAGLPWVASNLDLTIPTDTGIAPGNGLLVEVIRRVTGREPMVAGKPERPLVDEAVRRIGADRPLLVGDRLDTDITAAHRYGCDSLLVLTGVTSRADLTAELAAALRPTYVGADLRALLEPGRS